MLIGPTGPEMDHARRWRSARWSVTSAKPVVALGWMAMAFLVHRFKPHGAVQTRDALEEKPPVERLAFIEQQVAANR